MRRMLPQGWIGLLVVIASGVGILLVSDAGGQQGSGQPFSLHALLPQDEAVPIPTELLVWDDWRNVTIEPDDNVGNYVVGLEQHFLGSGRLDRLRIGVSECTGCTVRATVYLNGVTEIASAVIDRSPPAHEVFFDLSHVTFEDGDWVIVGESEGSGLRSPNLSLRRRVELASTRADLNADGAVDTADLKILLRDMD